jgi:hypothetical protein
MNRRFLIASLTLALTLPAFSLAAPPVPAAPATGAAPAAPAAAPATPGAPAKAATAAPQVKAAAAPVAVSNEAEIQKLKLAEVKLAALAKEGQPDKGATEVTSPKVKKAVPAKKKRHKARLSKKGKKGAVAGKALTRRLSESEVRGILSTTRDFTGADLSGMNLVGMNLSGAKLNRVNLRMANLERADLAETDLELADLTGANLRGASLNQARLRGTRLAGSKMDGALWIDKTICRSGSVGSCIE